MLEMMNLMKYKSVGESGGVMIRNAMSSLLKSPQKQLLMVESWLGLSDRLGVSAGFSTSSASETMGSMSFFNKTFREAAALDNNCFGKSATEQHVSFNQFPGLMVPGTDENSETRRFLLLNPNNGCSFEKDIDCNPLPVPHGYACHGSAYGWVFLVGDELDTKLMNSFTGEEIQLPSVRTLPRPSRGWMGTNKLYVLKAVFSSDPSLQPAPLVMIIHRGHYPRMAYCKPGDISWTSLHHRPTKHYYQDVIFYKDQFYAMILPGYIMAYDIGRRTDGNDHSVKKTLIASGPKELDKYRGQLYLVVLDGELIKLTRKFFRCEGCQALYTLKFMIRRFVASENKWVKVESLGDHALFLGRNTSFSLRASEHPGCIPNAIYFTDCSINQNQYDMGVYKLSDQRITAPLYPIDLELELPPPVWVTKVSSYAATVTQPLVKREPKKEEKKCQIIGNSQLQKERSCDDISSTQVKLDQFPGLMVHGMVENSKTRRLLRLNPNTGYFEQEQDVAAAANHDHSHLYELQVPHEHVCRGSAYGWLFLTDDNLDMKLLNPFSGAEIQLPPVKTLPVSEAKEDEQWPLSKWFVYKAVFSANPSMEPRPIVFIIYEGDQSFPSLAFCKPGDEGWTPLEFPIKRHFQFRDFFHKDVIYHNGQFYVLSHPGYVATFDIGRRIDNDDLSVKTTLVATAPGKGLILRNLESDWHLAVLDEELVKFELRKGCFYDCFIEKTKSKMEKQRNRDGDTTDADGDFVFDSSYARAKSKDLETETETDTDEEYDFNIVDADEDPETKTDSDEEYDFNIADADEDPETETIDEDEKDEDEKDDKDKCPCVDMNLPRLTYGIKIRRFDASEKKWVKVESLGDKAVFLGYNTSFALSASDYPAGHCIPDSIYFTYGGGGNAFTEKVCYDMGIYSVKDKIVKPLYQLPMPMPMNDDNDASQFKKPAPIWIVNSADRV